MKQTQTKEVIMREIRIHMEDSVYWRLKYYKVLLGIRRWALLMKVVAKILDDYLTDESKIKYYRDLAHQFALEFYSSKHKEENKVLKERETQGQSTPSTREADGPNHDNK